MMMETLGIYFGRFSAAVFAFSLATRNLLETGGEPYKEPVEILIAFGKIPALLKGKVTRFHHMISST